MLPAQFRAIARWLHRSRRFRNGPALIFMLTAVGSAEAPIRFLENKPAVSQAEPTPAKQSADAARTSVSLLGNDSPPDAPASSDWRDPQLAQNTNPDTLQSRLTTFPTPQPTPDNIISPFKSDPGPGPAVDLFPLESASANPVGNDFPFVGGSDGSGSNPAPAVVPPGPGTPVPEPAQLFFIAPALMALRRAR